MEIFFVLIRILQILTSENQSHQHINGVGYQVLLELHLCASLIETCPSLSSFNEKWRIEEIPEHLQISASGLSSISHIGQLCHMRSSQDQIPSRPLSRNLVENLSLEIGQDQIPVSSGCKWTHNYSMTLPVLIIHQDLACMDLYYYISLHVFRNIS